MTFVRYPETAERYEQTYRRGLRLFCPSCGSRSVIPVAPTVECRDRACRKIWNVCVANDKAVLS